MWARSWGAGESCFGTSTRPPRQKERKTTAKTRNRNVNHRPGGRQAYRLRFLRARGLRRWVGFHIFSRNVGHRCRSTMGKTVVVEKGVKIGRRGSPLTVPRRQTQNNGPGTDKVQKRSDFGFRPYEGAHQRAYPLPQPVLDNPTVLPIFGCILAESTQCLAVDT